MELLSDAETGCILSVLDPDGVVTAWGRAAERLTGYSASEMVGRHFSVIWVDPEETNELLSRVIAQGEIVEDAYLSTKDGDQILATRRVTALPYDQGELVGFVAAIVAVREANGAFAVPDRIAAALLETVVHPIFAAGLELNAILSMTTDLQLRRRATISIGRLDEALRNLRDVVGVTPPHSDPGSASPST
jgi:PAS domain S-box-containing protein